MISSFKYVIIYKFNYFLKKHNFDMIICIENIYTQNKIQIIVFLHSCTGVLGISNNLSPLSHSVSLTFT